MENDNFFDQKKIENEETSDVVVRKGWIPYKISTESNFFPIFQQVIKKVNSNTESIIIDVINKFRSFALKKEVKDNYKLVFDWIDDDTCAIDVFKKVEEEEDV